ncbi:hypothetical protein BGZ65_003553, partial [Modicella reniformis]
VVAANRLVSPSVLSLSSPPKPSSSQAKNFIDGDSEDKATKTKKRKRGISLSLFCFCLKNYE